MNSTIMKFVAAVVVGAGIVTMTGCEVDSTDTKGSTGVFNNTDEAKDVTLQGIDHQGFGITAAKIKVVNSSTKASDYTIEVSIESKDGKKQYDTSMAFVSNIKPGQSTIDTSAIFTKKIPADAVLVLGSVDRTESL